MALMNPVDLTEAGWPAPTSRKDLNPEDLMIRELAVASCGHIPSTRNWLNFAGRFESLAGQGSDNWAELGAAAWYLVSPDTKVESFGANRTAHDWWQYLAHYYLGNIKGAPGDLGFFMASEPRSTTYDGFTVGSWLAVLDCAITRGDTSTANSVRQLIEVYCAMVTLMSVGRFSPIIYSHHLDGTDRIKNPAQIPTVATVGARSTPYHLVADPAALLLTDVLGHPGRHPHPQRDPHSFWFVNISSRRAGKWIDSDKVAIMQKALQSGSRDHLDTVASLIPSTVRWKGNNGIEIRCYYSGPVQSVVGVLDECLNGNTAYNMISAFDHNQHNFFPWPKAKCGGLGSGQIKEEDGKIYCLSEYGELDRLQLPNDAPDRTYRFCNRGLLIS